MTKPSFFPLTDACSKFIQKINAHPLSLFFRKPYKPQQKDDDYFEVIRKPMDLSTVRKKLLNGDYITLKQWEEEVRLIFTNSILYNGETHLLGGISSYFLSKLDKFMENIENSNSRNFEEKTKNLYGDVLKLLREMPSFEVEYENSPLNESINANDQNIENQNEFNQAQGEEIQNDSIGQIQDESVVANIDGHEQNEEIHKIDYSEDFNESEIQGMYPFRSLNPQGFGNFDKQRMRKIKNGLNSLVSKFNGSNVNQIIMLIHESDMDFRCADLKEIDVASMSRRTLIEIEDYIHNANNNKVENVEDKPIIIQMSDQSMPKKPIIRENTETDLDNGQNPTNASNNGTTIINMSINANNSNNDNMAIDSNNTATIDESSHDATN